MMSSSQSKKKSRVSTSIHSQASQTHPESESLADECGYDDEGHEDLVDEPKEKRNYVKMRKKRGEFWNHFKSYLDLAGNPRAECIYCNSTFASHPSINGTKNLSSHWRKCRENPNNQKKGTPSQLVLDMNDEAAKLKSWVLDVDHARTSLSKMIVAGELPFRFVEKPFFKDFMASVCPAFRLPSRSTIRRDCLGLYLDEKEKLGGYLMKNCQRVCLTTDTWTSIQRVNYMSLTAHFIDPNWKLQKRILSFCPIVSHKGEDIASLVEDCLRPWNLIDKVFTVTVDNASANMIACSSLKDAVISNGGGIKGGNFMHMRCTAHIVNLIVAAGLKVHDSCIEKVRVVVKFVRNSPVRLHTFKKEAEFLKIECKSSLVFDVPTRWNSTYMMLDVALKFKNVFGRLETPRNEKGDSLGHITADEWAKIENIVIFLKVFYDLTNTISGSLYVTVGNIFIYISHLVMLLKDEKRNSDSTCHLMAVAMKKKCDKYWGGEMTVNTFILVAMILNPNFKFQGLKMTLQDLHGIEEGEEIANGVKVFTKELFDEYRSLYAPSSSSSELIRNEQNSESQTLQSGAPSYMKNLKDRLDKQGEIDGALFTSEFDRYFPESRMASETDDILFWWKSNANRFPILARLARDALAIPVTTVPSESAFSTGGRTLDHFRSSLATEMLEALICTQDWICANRKSGVDAYDSSDVGEPLEVIEELIEEMRRIRKE